MAETLSIKTPLAGVRSWRKRDFYMLAPGCLEEKRGRGMGLASCLEVMLLLGLTSKKYSRYIFKERKVYFWILFTICKVAPKAIRRLGGVF